MRQHDFAPAGGILHEPGISDIDGGQWARMLVACRYCGQERRVWRHVRLSLVNADRCPSSWFARVRARRK